MDLLIKNAKTIDNQKIDIAIKNGKIIDISSNIEDSFEHVYRCSDDEFISAGWIDAHVHCFEDMDLYRDTPDRIGVETGVTSLIDAGSSGAHNVSNLYEGTKSAKTNVYALLNISSDGIVSQDELSDLSMIEFDQIEAVVKKYPEFIVGLKARMSQSVVGDNGILPLEYAKIIQKKLNDINLMVHIGSAPPKLEDIISRLDKGDIITHCFNGKENNILDDKDMIKDYVLDAKQRGIIFDVGHGSASFSFDVAKKAFDQNFLSDMISTDIYERNRKQGPVYDMATTLEKMLYTGYPLETLIHQITEVPAKIFNLKNKGKIAVDYDADLTLFKIKDNDRKQLIDSNGTMKVANKRLIPTAAIVKGQVFRIGDFNGRQD